MLDSEAKLFIIDATKIAVKAPTVRSSDREHRWLEHLLHEE